MSSRTAKFVSAIFASFLAGALLTTVLHGAAVAADECLSGPKGQTPQGGHWYYRIDRATKRHCWYLADERAPQTAAPNSSTSAKPLAQDADTAMQHSVANARAELPAQTPVEPPNSNAEIAPALSVDDARSEDSGGVATPGTLTSRSVVASRWPDPYSAEPPANPPPDKRDPDMGVNPVPRTQPTSVLAAGKFAAADLSSETPLYSVQMQLAALMGMLALAGIMGTVIFKFGSSPRPLQSEIRKRRGPIWESTDDDRIVLSRYPVADGFARGFDQAADRSDRVAEFFAQISRRAPT
jgi:hypothetical protein